MHGRSAIQAESCPSAGDWPSARLPDALRARSRKEQQEQKAVMPSSGFHRQHLTSSSIIRAHPFSASAGEQQFSRLHFRSRSWVVAFQKNAVGEGGLWGGRGFFGGESSEIRGTSNLRSVSGASICALFLR